MRQIVRQEYLLMRIVCGRSIRCMYKHEAEWSREDWKALLKENVRRAWKRLSACVSEAESLETQVFLCHRKEPPMT